MPECAIGLIPDVGGSLILARAPGRLGEYLGTTGHRMGPDDAILAGFADYFVPQADWPALITMLEATGDWNAVDRAARPAPAGPLRAMQAEIDAHFSGEGLGDIVRSLRHADSDFTHTSEAQLMRGCPLSMACTIEMIRRLRVRDTIEAALIQEFRFTYRIAAMPDLAEGIRAAVIDKDRAPEWQHPQIDDIPQAEVSGMLLPLGVNELKLEDPS